VRILDVDCRAGFAALRTLRGGLLGDSSSRSQLADAGGATDRLECRKRLAGVAAGVGSALALAGRQLPAARSSDPTRRASSRTTNGGISLLRHPALAIGCLRRGAEVVARGRRSASVRARLRFRRVVIGVEVIDGQLLAAELEY
jgi:hypothetical protein